MRKATLEEIVALSEKADAVGNTTKVRAIEFPRLLEIAREQRAEIARLRNELEEANECRDPAYFAQLGRKRGR